MEGNNSGTEIGNNREMKQSKIPPLGVMPRFVFEVNRIRELQNAIMRFVEANRPIPQEIVIIWTEEESGQELDSQEILLLIDNIPWGEEEEEEDELQEEEQNGSE